MSRRPLRTPERETCAFCARHETTERAANDLGWIPSFWIIGKRGVETNLYRSVCAPCVMKHMEPDPQDRGDGPQMIKGHERYLRAKRARRLAAL